MKIHSLFILKEGGVCFYNRHFTDDFKNLQTDLITPFFSAILSFSEKVISKKLEILEMSELRFIFKKDRDFIFILLSDSSENYLFLNSRLDRVKNIFFRVYTRLMDEFDGEVIESVRFDNLMDSVIHGKDELLQVKSHGSYEKIIDYFMSLISLHEIIGAALLTTKGAIIYSSLTDDVLIRSMRELEIRYMSGTFDIPQILYELGNGHKVCERIIPYHNLTNLLLIVEFTPNTTLGMVDYNAETIVETVKKFI